MHWFKCPTCQTMLKCKDGHCTGGHDIPPRCWEPECSRILIQEVERLPDQYRDVARIGLDTRPPRVLSTRA